MASPVSPAVTRRAVLNTVKGSAGNLVEWYDVFIYTTYATYFEDSFFSAGDKNATVYTLAIFAATYLMRPIGAWWFGRFADRHGRRTSLLYCITLMAAGSGVIAILPTRASIGWLAAVVLLACRLVQGFATGGEYGTSATYMSEAATRGRRGFFSSLNYVTLISGQMLASLTLLVLQYALTEEQLVVWGWRIPFAIGAMGALVVLWLRRTMDESLSRDQLAKVRKDKSHAGSLRNLFTTQWRSLLIVFMITAGGTSVYYTYSVNALAIVSATYKSAPTTASWISVSALLVFMVLQPVGGLISDRIGRKPVLMAFGAGALIYTYFLVTTLSQVKSPLMSFIMLIIGFVILTGYSSVNAVVKAELFPFHVRALGVGLGYALANSTFGGTAPVIFQLAKVHNRVEMYVVYVEVLIAFSLAAVIFGLRNRAETDLDREQAATDGPYSLASSERG